MAVEVVVDNGYGNEEVQLQLQFVPDAHGCQEIIQLENRDAHESVCGPVEISPFPPFTFDYRFPHLPPPTMLASAHVRGCVMRVRSFCRFGPVRCPNSPQCLPMRRSELADHLVACTFSRCPQHVHGCTYSGTQDELAAHQTSCLHTPTHRRNHRDSSDHRGSGGGAAAAAADGAIYLDEAFDDEGVSAVGAVDELSSSTASAATLRAARDSPGASAAAAAASVTALIMEDHSLEVEMLAVNMQKQDAEIGGLNDSIVGLSDRLTQLEAMFLQRIESLETKASAIADGTTDANLAIDDVAEEIGRMQEVLGMQPGPVFEDGDIDDAFKCKGTFMGHAGPIWCFTASDNETLFSGSSDQTIKAWDTSAGSNFVCKKTLSRHEGIVHCLVCYDRKLYSGSSDQTINVWDVGSLELIDTLRGHDGPVCSLATANGMLFSGSHKCIKVWDIYTHALIGELTGLPHWVRCLSTSHDKLYAGSSLNIMVWGTKRQGSSGLQEAFDSGASPPPLNVLQTSGGGSVYSICATPTKVICGTSSYVVHVFDTTTLEELAMLEGHTGTIYSVAVMAESFGMASVLFSASFDSTIKVWDLDSLTCLQTLRKHEGSTNTIVVQQDWLFSGAADNTIKVWSRD